MKRILIFILLATVLLTGCAKVNAPQPNDVESVTSQTDSPKESEPPSNANSANSATYNDLNTLMEKLDETTDEQEREKILSDIQVILEAAEQKTQ